MRKISTLILYLGLLVGCAGGQTHPETNDVEVMRIGLRSENINNKMVVKEVMKGFPAERAGIKRGDVVFSINGKKFKNDLEILSLMNNMQRSDHVLLVINRNGKQINFDVERKVVKVRQRGIPILKILAKNNKVSLAIVIGRVNNTFPNTPADWADSIRNTLQSEEESFYLAAFENNENFSIVDRMQLIQILYEYQFDQVGFISDELRMKIGEMTGATHILDISYARVRGRSNSYKDVMNARLIEIKSGTVLADDEMTVRL
ncbi:MAG TPA: PDZ domain-containing protein [Nitrospirota bacterium]|nr:PDZ domain-containing protein [Nitrospirota bacterium]